MTQQRDSNYKGRVCSSKVFTESYGNLTTSEVIELENESQRCQQDYQLFMDQKSMFSNHLNVVQEDTRQKRQVKVLLEAGAALVLGHKLEAVGCKHFSICEMCKSKEGRQIEKMHEDYQRKNWNI